MFPISLTFEVSHVFNGLLKDSANLNILLIVVTDLQNHVAVKISMRYETKPEERGSLFD
jgi:hypothetical protein